MPHKSDSRKLYCTLTKHPLNKIPKQIANHVSSKKFKRLTAEFEEKQKLKVERQQIKEAKQKAWEERKAKGEASGNMSDNDSDASDFWVRLLSKFQCVLLFSSFHSNLMAILVVVRRSLLAQVKLL